MSWKFWKSTLPPKATPNPASKTSPPTPAADSPLPHAALTAADAIITPNEANPRHGLGILVERFFGNYPNTLSIRSQDNFGGEQSFGSHRLRVSHAGLARWESYAHLLQLLNSSTVRRIICIPFFADDLITAICLRDLFNCPLCIYIMDDNNVAAHGIPDDLFAEALWRSQLRLTISPEMRDAYTAKYGIPFHLLPPLVEKNTIVREPLLPESASSEDHENSEPLEHPEHHADQASQSKHNELRPGALVGNVWSQRWLDHLRATLRGSGVQLHWYGNIHATWLNYTQAELAADGITLIGFLPEAKLIERLRSHPYALIPSGTLDDQDDRPELARLSLPSRIPFLAAVANLPLIVLGHPETAAARFVKRLQLGLNCPYDTAALQNATASISAPDNQWFFRRNSAEKSSALTLDHPGEWIWNSLAHSAPIDDRFEKLMPPVHHP